MPKSATHRARYADYYFNQSGNAISRPTTFYLSRHSASPGINGANELPATGGNLRQPVANNGTNFDVASNIATLQVDVSWGAASANQATTSWVGLWSHATSTSAAFFEGYAQLDQPVAIVDGATFRLPALTGFTWTEE